MNLKIMYKAWIIFTTVAVVFFLVCLGVVVFQIRPVLNNYWEEPLLIVSMANLFIAYLFYRHNKAEFHYQKRRKND